MESMLTRVDKELAVIKDRPEADVTILGWVDRDVPIFHVAPLCAELLCVFRVLANLAS